MSTLRSLTATEILAAASEQFSVGEYRLVEGAKGSWDFPNSRLFEDKFGLVGLIVFETWSRLVEEWADAQGALVEIISRHMSRSDPKAWDGYLVLLTPGIRGKRGKEDWMGIRYNTKRIRKFVASGEDLKSISDVQSTIAPLLPFQAVEATTELDGSVLELLPDLLAEERDIPTELSRCIVRAFEDQKNMMQQLHETRAGLA